MSRFDLVVVMPCFNEADGLPETLSELIRFLRVRRGNFAIVIQDDKSTDNSVDIIRRIGVESGVKILLESNQINMGHGPTSLRAYQRALNLESERILFLDSDGQYQVDDLTNILNSGDTSDIPIVIGVRKHRADPSYRRAVSRALKWTIRMRFNVRSSDPNSPVRLFKREVLEALLQRISKDSLIPNIWLTIYANERKLKVVEVGVGHRPRVGGDHVGSTWRTAKLQFLGPVVKFIHFSTRCARELLIR